MSTTIFIANYTTTLTLSEDFWADVANQCISHKVADVSDVIDLAMNCLKTKVDLKIKELCHAYSINLTSFLETQNQSFVLILNPTSPFAISNLYEMLEKGLKFLDSCESVRYNIQTHFKTLPSRAWQFNDFMQNYLKPNFYGSFNGILLDLYKQITPPQPPRNDHFRQFSQPPISISGANPQNTSLPNESQQNTGVRPHGL